MKIANFFSTLMDNNTVEEIVEGVTGATLLMYTDRKAATVVETFKKGKYDYVVIQLDNATRVDGNEMSDMQSYTYERDIGAPKYMFRVTEKGFVSVYRDVNTGRIKKDGGYGLTIGKRAEYFDYSF